MDINEDETNSSGPGYSPISGIDADSDSTPKDLSKEMPSTSVSPQNPKETCEETLSANPRGLMPINGESYNLLRTKKRKGSPPPVVDQSDDGYEEKDLIKESKEKYLKNDAQDSQIDEKEYPSGISCSQIEKETEFINKESVMELEESRSNSEFEVYDEEIESAIIPYKKFIGMTRTLMKKDNELIKELKVLKNTKTIDTLEKYQLVQDLEKHGNCMKTHFSQRDHDMVKGILESKWIIDREKIFPSRNENRLCYWLLEFCRGRKKTFWKSALHLKYFLYQVGIFVAENREKPEPYTALFGDLIRGSKISWKRVLTKLKDPENPYLEMNPNSLNCFGYQINTCLKFTEHLLSGIKSKNVKIDKDTQDINNLIRLVFNLYSAIFKIECPINSDSTFDKFYTFDLDDKLAGFSIPSGLIKELAKFEELKEFEFIPDNKWRKTFSWLEKNWTGYFYMKEDYNLNGTSGKLELQNIYREVAVRDFLGILDFNEFLRVINSKVDQKLVK